MAVGDFKLNANGNFILESDLDKVKQDLKQVLLTQYAPVEKESFIDNGYVYAPYVPLSIGNMSDEQATLWLEEISRKESTSQETIDPWEERVRMVTESF